MVTGVPRGVRNVQIIVYRCVLRMWAYVTVVRMVTMETTVVSYVSTNVRITTAPKTVIVTVAVKMATTATTVTTSAIQTVRLIGVINRMDVVQTVVRMVTMDQHAAYLVLQTA